MRPVSAMAVRLDCVATMYKVFEVVAVYRFQSEVMAYDDDIAVGAIRLGHPYYAVEGTPYGVFGVGLDVYATVASPPPSVREMTFPPGRGKEYSVSGMSSKGSSISSLCENSPGVATRIWLVSMVEKTVFFPCAVAPRASEQERDKNTDSHLFKILYSPTGRGSIFLQQFQYHFGCFFQTFLPVVAVDNGKDMAGFKFHLGAFVVAGRGTDTA